MVFVTFNMAESEKYILFLRYVAHSCLEVVQLPVSLSLLSALFYSHIVTKAHGNWSSLQRQYSNIGTYFISVYIIQPSPGLTSD